MFVLILEMDNLILKFIWMPKGSKLDNLDNQSRLDKITLKKKS